MAMDDPSRSLSCAEYQYLAQQAPELSDSERYRAFIHLRDCDACKDKKTAFKLLQKRVLL